MPYTPVVPTTRWETDRADTNDFLMAMLGAFQAAVTGVVRQRWTEIPASFTGEVPLVYLGPITETILHDSGLRQTTFTGEIGYVDHAPDNQEANDRANVFADYMRELFTANARIKPTGILREVQLAEAPTSQGPLTGFMHLVLQWEWVIQQGRD
jgi:hypothetical protein